MIPALGAGGPEFDSPLSPFPFAPATAPAAATPKTSPIQKIVEFTKFSCQKNRKFKLVVLVAVAVGCFFYTVPLPTVPVVHEYRATQDHRRRPSCRDGVQTLTPTLTLTLTEPQPSPGPNPDPTPNPSWRSLSEKPVEKHQATSASGEAAAGPEAGAEPTLSMRSWRLTGPSHTDIVRAPYIFILVLS